METTTTTSSSSSESLVQAVTEGDTEKAKSLIDTATGESTSPMDHDGDSQAVTSVMDKADLLLTLAKKGTNVGRKDETGKSALDVMASTPEGARAVREAIVKPLVMAGEEELLTQMATSGWNDFDVTSGLVADEGETTTTAEDSKQLVGRLTELRQKISSLEAAIREGQLEKVKGLMEEAAVRSSCGMTGLPPLQQAVAYREPDVVQHIVTQFPDLLNLVDNKKRTALHYAAGCHDGGYIYQILQSAGADDTIQDMDGKTPQHYYQNDPQEVSSTTVQQNIQARLQGPTESQGPLTTDGDDQPLDGEAQKDGVELDQVDSVPAQAEEPAKPTTPPGPKVHKPVDVYVRGRGVNQQMAPPPTTKEGQYIAQQLGTALTLALAEIAEKRPWDPVEYLAKWLYKYHDNEAYVKKQAKMLKHIREEEADLNKEEELKFKRKEELLRFQEDEARKRKEEEDERRRKELEEMQRSNKENMLSQKPQLPTVTEDEEAEAEGEPDEDPNVKDRDIGGLTEMHKLASQDGIDLSSLLALGYSIADRDRQGRTARDIAQEAGKKETVAAIDAYLKRLKHDGLVDALETLVLEGYDVTNNMADEDLPEVTKNFLQKVETLQGQAESVQNAVSNGHLDEIKELLDATPKLDSSKDGQGRSLLHLAVLSGHPVCVQQLASHSPALLQSRDNANRTPLHYAYGVSDDIATLLLFKGAKANVRDVYKRNPAYYRTHKADIVGDTAPSANITPEVNDVPKIVEESAGDNAAVEDRTTADAAEEGGKADGDEETAQQSQLATTSVQETS